MNSTNTPGGMYKPRVSAAKPGDGPASFHDPEGVEHIVPKGCSTLSGLGGKMVRPVSVGCTHGYSYSIPAGLKSSLSVAKAEIRSLRD